MNKYNGLKCMQENLCHMCIATLMHVELPTENNNNNNKEPTEPFWHM